MLCCGGGTIHVKRGGEGVGGQAAVRAQDVERQRLRQRWLVCEAAGTGCTYGGGEELDDFRLRRGGRCEV